MKLNQKKPDKNTLLFILAGIHLSALPIYSRLPLVVIFLIVLLSLWQYFIISENKKNPGKTIQIISILLSFFTVLYSYGHIFGQQPGIALVILMTILKLFETKNLRDCYIIIYSSIFIIASNFFHSQSIWLILYVFFVVIYLLSALIALSDRLHTVSNKERLTLSSRFVLYAIPMMLILFVLFPRIPGPLWGLPNDSFSSKTGLSEEMSPGSINQLISSSTIAFRVKFTDDIPRRNQRYWRGVVLSKYDGLTWRRDDAPTSAKTKIYYPQNDKAVLQYAITLEPTNLSWLLSLEYPQTDNETTSATPYSLNREAVLITKNKISNIINYTITSQTDAINQSLFKQESLKNRMLPAEYNPETISFAHQLYIDSNYDHKLYINSVLSYFSNNDFIYTLSPDRLNKDAMDDFLFNTRRGFCEHYASAFVYLMRAAGLPARVVIGYQGGEMNPLDDYMIIRQSDAHAWTEVWIDNHWQRFDPTAAVSPNRVERGILNAGLEDSRLPLLLVSSNQLIKNMAFLYDSFQNSWNQWVIGFNQKKQNDLLKALGLDPDSLSNLILLLVICLSLAAAFIAWLLLSHNTTEKDRVQHYYNIFCKKLKRAGIQRALNEGPSDFEDRVRYHQKLSTKTRNNAAYIFRAYRALHYGNTADHKAANKFIKIYIRKVKSFS